jgi:two-component system response regulator MprA
MRPGRILVVHDEPAVRDSLAQSLAGEGLEVHTAAWAVEALEKADDVAPDIVLSDVQLPGMSGFELMQALRVRNDDVVVVLMGAEGDASVSTAAAPACVDGRRLEPFDVPRLLAVIALQLESLRQRRRTTWHPSR